VLATLAAPENLPIIREAIGLTDFIIPGEESRNKQYEETKQLLGSEPITGPDGIEYPSVEVDPVLDDHQIESDTLKYWLRSEAGQLVKTDNPNGYKNNLLHLKM